MTTSPSPTDGAASPEDSAELALARKLGREQAESFDLRLREAETRQREERLAEAAWRPRSARQAWDDEDASLKVVQLESRLSELSAYVRAVDNSLPWRMIQTVRRMLGRGW